MCGLLKIRLQEGAPPRGDINEAVESARENRCDERLAVRVPAILSSPQGAHLRGQVVKNALPRPPNRICGEHTVSVQKRLVDAVA
jgi:hypothetical protein